MTRPARSGSRRQDVLHVGQFDGPSWTNVRLLFARSSASDNDSLSVPAASDASASAISAETVV